MARANRRKSLEIPMNVDLPEDLAVDLDNFCDEHRVRKKAVVELALRNFLASNRSTSQRVTEALR